MQDDQTVRDATRLLAAFSKSHPGSSIVSSKARKVLPFGTDRPFVPNWADAEQAGLNRVRRDNAMRWLVDKDMLERDEETENLLGLLGTRKGFPAYDFGLVFWITDSGRELLEKARERRPE